MKSPIQDLKRSKRSQPMTNNEKQDAFQERRNTIYRRNPQNTSRRNKLEKKPEEWLKWYFYAAYPKPFSDGHKEIIAGAINADTIGGDIVVAAPRGEGKTTILRGVCIYLIVTKRCTFPVVGGWTHRAAKTAFKQWRLMVSSARFVADYPEYAQPFEITTHATRLRSLKWEGGKPCGADIQAEDLTIVFPDSLGALSAGSLNGDVKGWNIPLADGTVLRPNKLLLDDPQDAERAGDSAFVSEVIDRINSQWVCLAGPETRISYMAAVTIKEPNDVGETLGKQSGTHFVRISRITSWPIDFEQKDSVSRVLWNNWHSLYLDSSTRQAAINFYKKNKKKMTEGMRVSWAERYSPKNGDPDAMHAAMVDYYKLGDSVFASEYQNMPLAKDTSTFTVTSAQIMTHKTAILPGVVPEEAALTVCATDLNPSYGLTTEVASFSPNQSCHIPWYTVFCEPPLPIRESEGTSTSRRERVREALVILGRKLSESTYRPEHWVIDAGGEYFEMVTSFARTSEQECGLKAEAMLGRAGKTYNPNVRTRIAHPRNKVYSCREVRTGKWLCFDADYYKEMAQRSFLARVGSPGAASLYDGYHRDFAEQICREKLRGKGDVGGRLIYQWDTLPGRHDYLDTHAMCFAVAGWYGIGGSVSVPSGSGERPRRRVVNASSFGGQ